MSGKYPEIGIDAFHVLRLVPYSSAIDYTILLNFQCHKVVEKEQRKCPNQFPEHSRRTESLLFKVRICFLNSLTPSQLPTKDDDAANGSRHSSLFSFSCPAMPFQHSNKYNIDFQVTMGGPRSRRSRRRRKLFPPLFDAIESLIIVSAFELVLLLLPPPPHL